MVELIEHTTKSIVESPNKVLVIKEEIEKGIELKPSIDNKDMGYVINRGGRVTDTMWIVLRAISTKENRAVLLEIVGDK